MILTQSNQPAQVVIPSTEVQNHSNQNNANKTKNLKKVVRGLGITTTVLSILVFIISIAEVSIKECYYGSYYYECYNYTLGVGIWCSVFPFIAGIFGIVAGSNSSSQKKNGLLMGFSIAGACMSFLLIVLQTLLTIAQGYRYYSESKFGLQVTIMVVTGINMILLIISSAYSCCLCKSCCRKSVKPVERQIVFAYQNQQVPNQQTPGSLIYPQESQRVFHNQQQTMTSLQPTQQTSSPVAFTNQHFLNQQPQQHGQVDLNKQM